MKLAMVGLGKMGANMVRRLLRGGHECVVWNRNMEKAIELEALGAKPVRSFAELKKILGQPAVVWVMLPAGEVTENAIAELADVLKSGDTLIDGGNSFYKDDARRAGLLKAKGIRFVDAGVSGGVWGLERGYCLMVGGDKSAFTEVEPALKTLAPGSSSVAPSASRKHGTTADQGYIYCGPAGAGHFVKMVHNGIEYGMMEAYAEGFDILRHSGGDGRPEALRYDLNLSEISEVWRRGSVVSSWLLDLVALSLNQDPTLADFEGRVQDSGEGRWTVEAAIEMGVPAEVLASSLFRRFRSRETESYAEKLLSAMRFEFGGHVESVPPMTAERKVH